MSTKRCYVCSSSAPIGDLPVVVFFKKKESMNICDPDNLVFIYLCTNCDQDDVIFKTIQKKFAVNQSIESKIHVSQ